MKMKKIINSSSEDAETSLNSPSEDVKISLHILSENVETYLLSFHKMW